MNTMIDLGSELLVDGSSIRDPYVRLLTRVVGQKLARGSPWVAVDKRVAAAWRLRNEGSAAERRGRTRASASVDDKWGRFVITPDAFTELVYQGV
jgi:hypothetical protein